MKDYNGWSNYETWVTALWLNNNDADYWDEQAAACDSVEELAAELRRYHEDTVKEATDGRGLPDFANDMLTMAMGRIDWDEIAESIWAEREPDEEEMEDEEDAE